MSKSTLEIISFTQKYDLIIECKVSFKIFNAAKKSNKDKYFRQQLVELIQNICIDPLT